MATKTCETCSIELGRGNRSGLCISCYQKKWYKENKDQADATSNAWKDRNREKVKSYKLKYVHGITLEQYNEMYLAQQGCCLICQIWLPVLHLDHDHACCDLPRGTTKVSCGKCIRGLLCMHCNNGLGAFRDDTQFLMRAIAYLSGDLDN